MGEQPIISFRVCTRGSGKPTFWELPGRAVGVTNGLTSTCSNPPFIGQWGLGEWSATLTLPDYGRFARNTSATQRASGDDSPPSQCLQYFRLPFVYRSG